MRSAVAIFGAIVTAIVIFTFLAGGGFSLGTSGGIPFLSLNFKGRNG